MDRRNGGSPSLTAADRTEEEILSVIGRHASVSSLQSRVTSQRLRLFAQMFVTPGPGETVPDPRSLGDPAEYDGLGSFVRLL